MEPRRKRGTMLLNVWMMFSLVGSSIAGPFCGYGYSHKKCVLDLLFLLNGSGSIDPAKFDQSKDLVRKVAETLGVSYHNTHIAVMTFDTDRKLELGFTTHLNTKCFINALQDIEQPRGGTLIIPALQDARLGVLPSGRPCCIRKVVIVVTDGITGEILNNIEAEAAKLHEKAITYAVSVNKTPGMGAIAVLNAMSSGAMPFWILGDDDDALIRDLVLRFCHH